MKGHARRGRGRGRPWAGAQPGPQPGPPPGSQPGPPHAPGRPHAAPPRGHHPGPYPGPRPNPGYGPPPGGHAPRPGRGGAPGRALGRAQRWFTERSGGPDARRWHVAWLLTVAGTETAAIAMPVHVHAETESALLTALVTVVGALPLLLLGLVVAGRVDRSPRRRQLLAAHVVGAAAVATVPLAWFADALTTGHVLVVVLVVAAAFVWFDAAASGVLARVAGRQAVGGATELIRATTVATTVVTLVAVAATLAVADPAALLILQVVALLAAAVVLTRVTTPLGPERVTPTRPTDPRAPDPRGAAPAAGDTLLQPRAAGSDTLDTLRLVWRTAEARVLAIASTALAVSTGSVLAVLVVFARADLDADRHEWRVGVVLAASALGGFAATALLPRLFRRIGAGRTTAIAFAVGAPVLIVLALTATFWPAAALILVWTAATSIAAAGTTAALDRVAPAAERARITSLTTTLALAGVPVGALVAGVVASSADAPAALVAACVPIAVATIAVWTSPVGRLRLPDRA